MGADRHAPGDPPPARYVNAELIRASEAVIRSARVPAPSVAMTGRPRRGGASPGRYTTASARQGRKEAPLGKQELLRRGSADLGPAAWTLRLSGSPAWPLPRAAPPTASPHRTDL